MDSEKSLDFGLKLQLHVVLYIIILLKSDLVSCLWLNGMNGIERVVQKIPTTRV